MRVAADLREYCSSSRGNVTKDCGNCVLGDSVPRQPCGHSWWMRWMRVAPAVSTRRPKADWERCLHVWRFDSVERIHKQTVKANAHGCREATDQGSERLFWGLRTCV